MDKKNDPSGDQQANKEKTSEQTRESLDNAEKAKQGRSKTSDKSPDQFSEEEKKDAEKWRNEG